MTAKTVATLTNTDGREWTVTEEGTGAVLVRLDGVEALVVGMAAASLVADHGYPAGGSWVPSGAGRYVYVVEEQPGSTSDGA
jgi:hypothetical protein